MQNIIIFEIMIDWHKYPLVRIVLAFSIGIISYLLFPAFTVIKYQIVLSVIVVLLFIAFLFNRKITFVNRNYFGVLVVIAFVLMGYLWSLFYDQKQLVEECFGDIAHSKKELVFTGVVISDPVEKENSFQAIVRVESVYNEFDSATVFNSKVVFYFFKDSAAQLLNYGDKIIAKAYLNALEEPKNPGMFNYKRYLRYKNIFVQGYIAGGKFKILEHKKASIVKQISISLRDKLLNIFKENGIKGREYALATALVIGYDENIDGELRDAYSEAGVMHVLCVSGLHVGIIFLFIRFLLNIIPPKIPGQRYVKVVIILVVLWFYAFITGLAPAVFRAVLMFSFVALGGLLQRKTRIYNTLAASAFVLLLINPFILIHVGFQMSYLAVVGIVFLQPKIYNLLYLKNWLLDKMWSLTSVSLAAQLLLAPLLIFYFHKISILFFISNIIAIPLATLILYLGFVVIMVSWIPGVNQIIAFLFIQIIKILNFSVFFISAIPGSNLSGMWISLVQMLLIYGVLAGVVFRFVTQKTNCMLVALSCLILFAVDAGYQKYINKKSKSIIVYHLNKGCAADFCFKK